MTLACWLEIGDKFYYHGELCTRTPSRVPGRVNFRKGEQTMGWYFGDKTALVEWIHPGIPFDGRNS